MTLFRLCMCVSTVVSVFLLIILDFQINKNNRKKLESTFLALVFSLLFLSYPTSFLFYHHLASLGSPGNGLPNRFRLRPGPYEFRREVGW